MRSDLSSARSRGSVGPVLMIALALALASGCEIKEPAAPSWEVEYSIPLLNQWLDIVDLFDDEEFTDVGGDSVYFFEFEESLDRMTVGTEITIDDIDESISQAIGSFTVPAITPQSVSVSLGDIYPPLAGVTGTIPLVPAFSLPAGLTQSLPAFSGFTQVTIDTGTVTLSVTNNTRVSYSSLGVKLLDVGAGSVEIVDVDITAATGSFDHGENVVLPVSLAGKSLGNQMEIELYGSSPGGTNVTLDGTEGIDIQVTVGEMRVSSAAAEVGEIDYDFTDAKVPLPDEGTLSSVTLSSGTMTLSIDNQLPIPFELGIEFTNMTDIFGSPVSLVLNAPAGAQAVQNIDLTDHTFAPSTEPDGSQSL